MAFFVALFAALLATAVSQTNPNNPTYIANAQALTGLVTQLQNDILQGIQVPIVYPGSTPIDFTLFGTTLLVLPGNFTLTAGLVSLPTDGACNQQGPLKTLTCYIGAADCLYVHNKYSGHCGLSPNPVNGTSQTVGPVFVCNDVNPTSFNFVDIVGQCGPLIDDDVDGWDSQIVYAIGALTRLRMDGILCSALFPGCSTDCRNNHQYSSGSCVTNATPVAVYPNESNVHNMCLCQ